jgi:putative acetyltransferase
MAGKPEIRKSARDDLAAIESLYPRVFPEEDLLPLVRDLLQDPGVALSLVGVIDAKIAGHVVFTMCGVDGSDVKAALLGPLAVEPARQRQGVGSALVHAGLQRLASEDVDLVCVLGDPRYYSRLGFIPDAQIEPPFPLPTEWESAWQSQYLNDTPPVTSGRLAVPLQWLKPALWAP